MDILSAPATVLNAIWKKIVKKNAAPSASDLAIARASIGVEPYQSAALPGIEGGNVGGDGMLSVTAGAYIPTQYGGWWGWAGISHALFYGQSLWEGAFAVAIQLITSTTNVMFNTGQRSRDGSGNSLTPTSFVALVSTNDSATLGETPGPGFASGMSRIITGLGYNPAQFKILVSTAARGGQTMATLAVGGSDWVRVRSHVSWGRDLALASKTDYALMVFLWGQGEADVIGSPTSYGITCAAMRPAIQRYGSAAGGTSHIIPMIAYQMTDHATEGTQCSCLGILHARTIDPYIYIAFPKGFLLKQQNNRTFYHTDFVHLSQVGEVACGYKLSQVTNEIVVKGNYAWKGVEIIDVYVIEDVVYVKYNVPYPPLVLDTTDLMLPITDYGYKITDGTGVLTITDVSIIHGDTVKIVCNRTLVGNASGNATLQYGLDYTHANYGSVHGGCGNLRDSDPFSFQWDDGLSTGGLSGPLTYRFPNPAISQPWTIALN